MVAIGIIITQLGVPGGSGASRQDLILGSAVTLSNVSGSGVTSYKWEFIGKPFTSSATLSSTSTSTVTFTPDVTGSYLVQLTINNKLKQRVVCAVLTDRFGIRIPAAGEGEEIVGGSFKAITESIRTLESGSMDASMIQGEDVSDNSPGLNDFLRYNGAEWIPSGKMRTDDIGFRNTQDILIKIPLSAAIPANAYWEYDAGTSSLKPCWKTVTSGGAFPVLDFSWNVFPHGSILKKICVVASCTNTITNQLTIKVDKSGAIWNSNQIVSFVEQFVSTTQHTVSSSVSSVLEVSANTTFTQGNGNDDVVESDGLSLRITADGINTFKIYAVYAYFQTLAIGLYNGPLEVEGGSGEGQGDEGGSGSSGCCPFNIVVVNDAAYNVPSDGYNSMYVSNKPGPDTNVVFVLPKSVDAGEGANFEFLAIGTYNTSLDGKFVISTDPADVSGITWVGGDHSAANLVTDQTHSKIRLVADGVSGWYAESGEGLWGSSLLGVDLRWKYDDKFLYTANVVDSVENNITTFDAYGNIQDSGVPISSIGGVTTMSNYGIGGVGVYDSKDGYDFRLRNINVASNKLSVALDNTNHEVDLDVVEANIVHQNLSGSGLYDHAQVDAHMDSYSNPHQVTQSQVGLSNVINFHQVKGAETVRDGYLVMWGVDGYTVSDSGIDASNVEVQLTFTDSVVRTVNTVNLDGDVASPSNNYFYGTERDGSGKGWLTRNIARRVTVGIDGYDVDYTSIRLAVLAAIADGCSATAQWEIIVYPGIYVESPMVVPLGINIISHEQRINTAFVVAENPNADLFTLAGGYICGLNVSGVVTPYCLFRSATPYTVSVLHGVSFNSCYQGLVVSSGSTVITTNTAIFVTNVGEEVDTAILCTGAGSYVAVSGMFALASGVFHPATNPIQTVIKIDNGGEAYVSSGVARVASNHPSTKADVVLVDGGGSVLISGVDITGCGNALHIGANGTDSQIVTQGANLQSNDFNVVNDSSSGKIFANHTSDVAGYSGLTGTQLSGIIQYRDDALVRFIGNVEYQYLDTGVDVAFDRYFSEHSATGISIGGVVEDSSGLFVDVSEGYGWIRRGADSYDCFDVSWDSVLDLAVSPSTTNYIIYNSTAGAIQSTESVPTYGGNILLATVVTDGSGIRFLHKTRNFLTSPMEQIRDYLLATRKRMLNSGLVASSDLSPPIQKFSISAGSYYIGLDRIFISEKVDADFNYFYNAGATEVTPATDSVDVINYDNAGTLTALQVDGYRADTVVLTSDQRVSLIYGTEDFATVALAEDASQGSIPSFMEHTAFPIALLIVQQNVGIVSIVDLRSQEVSSTGGGSGTNDHNSLLNLTVGDVHTQYLPVSGGAGRPMSGDLYMGTNNIITSGNVDGVDVSTHASRHLPGGSDALTTAVPVAVLVNASAAAGSATSFARSDHQHGIATGTPSSVGTANATGSSSSVPRLDHVHGHGNHTPASATNENFHGVATTTYAGFMSAADKLKVHDAVTLASSATTGGLSLATQQIGFQAATTTLNGYLTSTDWNTFNNKLADPMTTRGDVIYRNASNVTARLGRGTSGQVLRSDGTDISWYTLEKIAEGNSYAEINDDGGATTSTFIVNLDGTERVRVDYAGNTGFGTSVLTSGGQGRIVVKGTTADNTSNVFVGRTSSADTGTSFITSSGEIRAAALSIGNTTISTAPTSVCDFITETANTLQQEIFIGPTTNTRGNGLSIGTSLRSTTNHMLIGKNIHGDNSTNNYLTFYNSGGSLFGYVGIEFMPLGVMRFLGSNVATTAGGIVTPNEVVRMDGVNNSLLIGTATYGTGGRLIVQGANTTTGLIFVGRDSGGNNVSTLDCDAKLTLGSSTNCTGSIVLVGTTTPGDSVTLSVPDDVSASWILKLPAAIGSANQVLSISSVGSSIAQTQWTTIATPGTNNLTASSPISVTNGTGVLSTNNANITLATNDIINGTNIVISGGSSNSIVGSSDITISTSLTPTFTSVSLTKSNEQIAFNSLGLTGTLSWTPTGSGWVLTLPPTPGSPGQYLTTSGGGILTWTTLSYESPLTFSTGLTRAVNTVTSNLSTGVSGGQSVTGGTGASEILTLVSTSNATKGKIRFGSAGTSYYDEVNNYFGIYNSTPTHLLTIGQNSVIGAQICLNGGTSGNITIFAPAAITSWSMILPTTGGSSGQVLTMGPGGATSWAAITEADTLATVTGRGATTLTLSTFSGNIIVGRIGSSGLVRFDGSVSGSVMLMAPSTISSWAMTLPTAVPAANGYVLSSLTTGVTSWVDPNIHLHDANVQNVFVGDGALGGVEVGAYNTAVGRYAISSLTDPTAINNTALGTYALRYNSTGVGNTGLGAGAGSKISTGSYNTAIGYRSMYATSGSITGSNNIGIGSESLLGLTSGVGNVSFGYRSSYSITTANHNIAIGYQAGYRYVGDYNIGIGYQAAAGIYTGATDNIGIGRSALGKPSSTYTTGSYNIAIGAETLDALTTGYQNTIVGAGAGSAVSTGYSNCLFGYGSGTVITTGHQNTFLGAGAGAAVNTGLRNTLIGSRSGLVLTSGEENIFVGSNAAIAATVGDGNIVIGVNAEINNNATAGHYNIAIGYNATCPLLDVENNNPKSIAIGYNAEATNGSIAIGTDVVASVSGSPVVRIGKMATYAYAYVGGLTWQASDQRLKSNIQDIELGLDFIKKLHPVEFKMKRFKDGEYFRDASRRNMGFVAQEVLALNESSEYCFVDDPLVSNPNIEKENSYMSVSYQDFIAPMVKAIQEQQEMIEILKKEIELLKTKIS